MTHSADIDAPVNAARLRQLLADPDEEYGAGTLHDNAPADYTEEEAHIWTVGYRAALEYVSTRVYPPVVTEA